MYLREAYNPFIAFLFGWTQFGVIQTGTIAAVAMAFAKYLGYLEPALSEKNVLWSLGGFSVNMAQLVAISFHRAANLHQYAGREEREDHPDGVHFHQALLPLRSDRIRPYSRR